MVSSPFSHSSLELKRQFLAIAKKFHDETHEGDEESVAYEFAAALMYMNIADYLAQYLAYGITELASEAVGEYHLGVISMRKPTTKNITIEESLRILKPYDFPRKNDVIASLNKAKESRNKLAHEILKIEPERGEEIDQAVRDLKSDTEDLVAIVDQIQSGMPPRNMKSLIPNE